MNSSQPETYEVVIFNSDTGRDVQIVRVTAPRAQVADTFWRLHGALMTQDNYSIRISDHPTETHEGSAETKRVR